MCADRVQALSFEAYQCGKRVSETKKRFVWKLQVGSQQHKLELLSSALSGKKSVHLNHICVYEEKNLMNTKFDFSHVLDGHILRIFRNPDSVNSFHVRIDNQSFEDLMQDKSMKSNEMPKPADENHDPFSDFANCINDSLSQEHEFGDFDFSNSSHTAQVTSKQGDTVDLNAVKLNKEPLLSVENFQTNTNYERMHKNLTQKQDQYCGDFTTNAYSFNNHYADLVCPQQQSHNYSESEQPKQTWTEKVTPNLSSKQMVNRTKMAAGQLKKKATDFFREFI